MNDTIAVILSVYKNDKETNVRLALDSILNQTYKNIHLFIGVDGPIDDDVEVCLKEYETRDTVSVTWFSKNMGLAVILNNLLNICFNQGYDLIARMDADDISMPNRLEKQISFILSHPEIDVVGGAITEIDEAGEYKGKTIIYPATPAACRSFFSKRNPHAHPTVLFRKRFFDKIGRMYRPEYRQNQDTMLWFDGLCKGTQHANIPDIILKFRVTDSLFKKRRNGWKLAKKQLQDRIIINQSLGYGVEATAFAYAMFVLLISPPWLKKIAYRLFR